jgi:selT/selW/selH-like putative selenoprotein
LAEELLHDHPEQISQVTLIPSSDGVYEINYGSELLWSKKATGDFPDPEAIKGKFAAA